MIDYKKYANDDGIPVIRNSEWKEIIQKYPKEELKTSLAEYLINNKIKFPYRKWETEEIQNLFLRFYNQDLSNWIITSDVYEPIEYKYSYKKYPLGIISKSHVYNAISNYFQQENRLKCGAENVLSPLEIWNDLSKLKKYNWHFWRSTLENSDIGPATFRSAFRLGSYTAAQFRPSVAKILYERYNAKSIADCSCGWGDRLAGFYGSRCTESYVGCDPNPMVYEYYKKQCVTYERWLGNEPQLIEMKDNFICKGLKTVQIWNKPAEDLDWSEYSFDLFFSSPPYFATEKYGVGSGAEEDQSWSRYKTFESWRDEFLFKVIDNIWGSMKKDSIFMMNIIEPNHKGKRMPLCDNMVDHIIGLGGKFDGQYLMRMMGRPNIGANLLLGEPIWTFSKGNGIEINKKGTIEDFM